MERMVRYPKYMNTISHEFYCDMCQEFLGQSVEHEDGWYSKIGDYHLRFHAPEVGWFYSDKHLCDSCKHKYNETIRLTLEALGFVLDK